MKVVDFFLLAAVPAIQATIAGLTYKDKMDFASRYRNVHECDPFYYHPLHLPDYCADMFEKLIRSRIGSPGAMRITERKYDRAPEYDYTYENADEVSVEYRKLNPYEQMFFSLNKDVENHQSTNHHHMSNAKVIWSNLGPVAVYQQPISRVSKDGIYQYFKKTLPKKKRSKKKGLKMYFWYGKNKIELNVDKNDNYVIYET